MCVTFIIILIYLLIIISKIYNLYIQLKYLNICMFRSEIYLLFSKKNKCFHSYIILKKKNLFFDRKILI